MVELIPKYETFGYIFAHVTAGATLQQTETFS